MDWTFGVPDGTYTFSIAPDTDGGDQPPPNDPGSTGHAPTQPKPEDEQGDEDEQ